MWRDVLHPRTGRLLFRVDLERMLVQIQERGEKFTIDLAEFYGQRQPPTTVGDLLPTKVVVR